jgi:hypothetical protein
MINKFKADRFEKEILENIIPISKSPSEVKIGKKILIEGAEDKFYLAIFGLIIRRLSGHIKFDCEIYVPRNFSVGESKGPLNFLIYRLAVNFLKTKYVRLYKKICQNGVGFECNCSFSSFKNILSLWPAYRTWKKLKDKKDVLEITIDGVVIGDLIYDTYLRFKPAATIDVKNIYLLFLIWHAYSLFNSSKSYFSKNNIGLYLTSYSTYINNGIPVRVALMYDVNIFSFGNYQNFYKNISKQDWYHTRNSSSYHNKFLLKSNQSDLKKLAEIKLKMRTSGAIDESISYMKLSPYADTQTPIPNVRDATVVFLHDFFDSPHIYPWMLFTDFWEWIIYTIEVLEVNNIPYFIKAHPNSIADNIPIIRNLKKIAGEARFIDQSISNAELVNSGIKCAVTCYGSVASEMAFLGVPTIACGYSPHLNFSFCKTPSSIAEYEKLLLSDKPGLIDSKIAYDESLIFYYMHNLDSDLEDIELNRMAINLRNSCDSNAREVSLDLIDQIKNSKGFNRFYKDLLNILTVNFKANL